MSSENIKQEETQPNQLKEKLSFKWILLGVVAVLLMWMVSAWLFKS